MTEQAQAPDGAADEGLHEPLPPALLRLLRRAVYDHATVERRRWHVPILHVGEPGGVEQVFAVRPEARLDQALRTDVVAAMVHRWRLRAGGPGRPAGPPVVWLVRAGGLELQDLDVQWLAGARQAFTEAGLPLVYVVVDRHGWRDPRSGAGRTWARMRRRSPGH